MHKTRIFNKCQGFQNKAKGKGFKRTYHKEKCVKLNTIQFTNQKR